jgi:methylated-DNA-[protein]-cysteine S-methyltransferase
VPRSPLDTRLNKGCHPPPHNRQRSRLPQLSIHSPIGDLTLSEESGRIVALDWGWGRDQTETPLLRAAREQVFAYFDGALTGFDLPMAPAGSAYQRRVWEALCAIPYGQTLTYAQVAARAGGVARSVGQANSVNPIPILIPCHRVVAAAGLGGYSGGQGLDTKRWLLALETRRTFMATYGENA